MLSILGGSSAAAEIDWKSLPYFDFTFQRLRISTDASWRGAHTVDASRLNLERSSSWPKLPRQWIWAASCGQGAQRVVFSKTFLAPGVPIDGNLDLLYGPGNQVFGNRPYVSAVVQINGIEIGRLDDLAHFPRKFASALYTKLTPRALKAFRYGPNQITIRAERAALTKKGDRCTHPWATSGGDARYIAIAADLDLSFGGDVRAIPSDAARQVYKGVQNGQSVTISGTSRFSNDGPSSSMGGTFSVNISGDGQSALAIAAPQAPLERSDCELVQTRMTCSYNEVKAGVKTGIQIVAGTKVNTGYFRNGAGRMTLQWSVDARGPDPNGSNNTTELVIILCTTGATDPACA